MISKNTAMDIALAYREIEAADEILKSVRDAMTDHGRQTDIRDAFGRTRHGLEMGVPSGNNGHRLFNVPYALAVPVIEAHIAQSRAKIVAPTEKARHEIDGPDVKG